MNLNICSRCKKQTFSDKNIAGSGCFFNSEEYSEKIIFIRCVNIFAPDSAVFQLCAFTLFLNTSIMPLSLIVRNVVCDTSAWVKLDNLKYFDSGPSFSSM